MKQVNPEKWKNALGFASKAFDFIGNQIGNKEDKGDTKGLFDKQEQIDALNAQLATDREKDEKNKKMMIYIAIGAVVLLVFGKKLMKR